MEQTDIRDKMYLKIPYSILDCGWISSPNTFLVFIHLMLLAKRKAVNYRGETINKGEALASYSFLAEHTGLSIQNVRTAIKNLKKSNMISTREIQGVTVIKITRYLDYQSLGARASQENDEDLFRDEAQAI